MVLPISQDQLKRGLLHAHRMAHSFTTEAQAHTTARYILLLTHALRTRNTDPTETLEHTLTVLQERLNAIHRHK